MAKRNGELTPKEAAYELECDYRTITRWARASLEGEPSRLRSVRRTPTGRILLSADEVRELARSSPKTDALDALDASE